MTNTVTYHVYLTFGNGETEFLATRTQQDVVDRVWASRNVLETYAVYAITSGSEFVNLTTIVRDYVNDREDANNMDGAFD
jgi:hypothetical protein